MGIVIASVATQSGGASSIEQAAAAAGRALEQAGIGIDEVGALINVGIYRDSNMVEPAMAALIQMRAGIGLEYRTGTPPCLSFDLMNGAVGVLNAVQVAQAMVMAGSLRHVLVVSGDAHPSRAPAAHPEFPIAPVGAAVVLRAGEAPEGFGTLHVSAGEPTKRPVGYLNLREMGTAGRSTILVDRTATPVEPMVREAVTAARAAIDAGNLNPARSLLICGRPAPDFPDRLAAELDCATVVCLDVDAHTSALPAAYEMACADGALAGAETVLFVAAGAGPTAAAIAYTLPGRP